MILVIYDLFQNLTRDLGGTLEFELIIYDFCSLQIKAKQI